MIKVPKFLFYVITVIILCVCVTFCILAVVNNDASGLISNITLTITSVLGLVITVKDDESKVDEVDDDEAATEEYVMQLIKQVDDERKQADEELMDILLSGKSANHNGEDGEKLEEDEAFKKVRKQRVLDLLDKLILDDPLDDDGIDSDEDDCDIF